MTHDNLHEDFAARNREGWSIYKITNMNPKDKRSRKRSYYFVTSQFDNEEDVMTRVRAMLKSKTTRGGIKAIAGDMARDEDYDKHFTVKKIAKDLSRERAEELRTKYKGNTPKKLIYNKPRKGGAPNV